MKEDKNKCILPLVLPQVLVALQQEGDVVAGVGADGKLARLLLRR